jgi:hypothetical protein
MCVASVSASRRSGTASGIVVTTFHVFIRDGVKFGSRACGPTPQDAFGGYAPCLTGDLPASGGCAASMALTPFMFSDLPGEVHARSCSRLRACHTIIWKHKTRQTVCAVASGRSSAQSLARVGCATCDLLVPFLDVSADMSLLDCHTLPAGFMEPVRKKLSQKRIKSDTENQMPLPEGQGVIQSAQCPQCGCIPHTASELLYMFG